MMSLREYRNKAAHLADFLPWAALVAEGVVLNKDGSFQRTARFRGPDLDSATPAELVATTARLNSSLRRLGSGWAIFVEAQRTPALDYPDVTSFPIRSRRWSRWNGANSSARKARTSRAPII
jgi:type IV secretory pathway VirB4 component